MVTIKYTAEKDSSWKELKAAAQAGRIREVLSSGNRIHVTLKTGEEVVFVATYDEKGKLFFVMEDCLKDPRRMNEDPTNEGGWAASELRKIANGEIFESLPDDLQEVIVPTKIVQVIKGERIECEDKLFCLSFTQIRGRVEGWEEIAEMEPEDSQLDIFKSGERSRVKERAGATTFWWSRSPYILNSNGFIGTSTSGYVGGYNYAGSRYGVSLGFCIHDPDNLAPLWGEEEKTVEDARPESPDKSETCCSGLCEGLSMIGDSLKDIYMSYAVIVMKEIEEAKNSFPGEDEALLEKIKTLNNVGVTAARCLATAHNLRSASGCEDHFGGRT